MSSTEISTRSKIIRACWDLMVDNVGQGVTLSQIAKAAGISRQALYLHFKSRADLLIATTREMDDALGIAERLRPYREATDGLEKMKEFIAFWAGWMEEVQGVARALIAMKPSDTEANAAWTERMENIPIQFKIVTDLLAEEGRLTPDLTPGEAAELMATTMSFHGWDTLRREVGWSQSQYIDHMKGFLTRAILAR